MGPVGPRKKSLKKALCVWVEPGRRVVFVRGGERRNFPPTGGEAWGGWLGRESNLKRRFGGVRRFWFGSKVEKRCCKDVRHVRYGRGSREMLWFEDKLWVGETHQSSSLTKSESETWNVYPFPKFQQRKRQLHDHVRFLTGKLLKLRYKASPLESNLRTKK